jgi:nickel/cobalt exporter
MIKDRETKIWTNRGAEETRLSLRGAVRDEAISGFGQRLLRSARNDPLTLCHAVGGGAHDLRPGLSLRLRLASLLLAAHLLLPHLSSAHPMGNFSINHFSALEVHPTLVRIVYILDFAEIPTFQEMQEHDLIAQVDDPRVVTYRERKVQELQPGLLLRVGEQVLPLAARSSTVSFPPGAGGLPTLRIEAVYEAPLEPVTGEITYEDRNYTERVGWKEIVAVGSNGVVIAEASVPAESTSQRLTVYADEFLQAPPQDLSATLSFTVPAFARSRSPASSVMADPSSSVVVGEAQTPRSLLTELMTAHHLSGGVIAFSLLVAFGLGAFHALEPGHGKTLVAAYLVGSRGTAWHALVLGLTVTVSHTIGVYALGAVALFAAHYVLPEQLYPWLGLLSGLLIAGVGIVLLTQAWNKYRGSSHHDHSHAHDDEHSHDHGSLHIHHHHEHSHPHPHDHLPPNSGQPATPVGYGALLTLGITGGMIPCPAALVVLLSAVALQRIAFGLLLIVAFSVGLAAVLVGTGLLLVSARGVLQRWSGDGPWQTYLPFVSPLVITPLGLLIAFRSLSGLGSVAGLPF